MNTTNWDQQADVLVIGSGAGGMVSVLAGAETRRQCDIDMRDTAEMDDRIRFSLTGHVARLTVDVPERLNAFDGDMALAVRRHLEDAAADSSLRVLVLCGAGGAFSAGGDLKSILGPPVSAQTDAKPVVSSRDLLRISSLLRSIPPVTIAAIDGVCAGGALGWACSCDLRVASTSARFVPAFSAAGQTGDYGITWTLPRIIGEGRARDLLLVGDPLDADEAERIGLVSRVYDQEVFEARVTELAELLASRAPLALQGIKKNLEVAGCSSLDEALDVEAATMDENMSTADAAEAARAFLEKRQPHFVGR